MITTEGLERLKEELEYLQTAKRREVAERIKEARELVRRLSVPVEAVAA